MDSLHEMSNLFSEKSKKKTIINLLSVYFVQRLIKVKHIVVKQLILFSCECLETKKVIIPVIVTISLFVCLHILVRSTIKMCT